MVLGETWCFDVRFLGRVKVVALSIPYKRMPIHGSLFRFVYWVFFQSFSRLSEIENPIELVYKMDSPSVPVMVFRNF